MSAPSPTVPTRAVIAAVKLQGVDDATFASSIAEFRRLASTLGLQVVGTVTQRRAKLAPGQVFGDGKLKELAAWTGGKGEIAAYQKPGTKPRRPGVKKTDEDEDEDDEETDEDDEASEAETETEAEAEAEAEAETETETEAETETETEAEAEAETETETETEAEAEAEAETETEAEAETETVTETVIDAEAEAVVGPPDGELCTVVLVDHDLSPTQQRNLERVTDAEVMDRSSVILAIFHRHARTREARLQVEIARLAYLAPRLRESGGGGDRVRGGVGGKGAGESKLELDHRRIRDRIAELRRELATIEGGAKTRRARRDDARTVAVVGYTNAGKSSLMRALTGSEVYVADKLFATLDTTVRILETRTRPPILLSDTVGFIKKLPHDLVASFRSTLDEASNADLLLHVVDASDAAFRDHMAVTRDVLGDIGADSDELLVLNKADRLSDDERATLALAFPDAVIMSAKAPDDVSALREKIVERFAGAAVDAELFVPWARHKLVHEIHARCRVLSETHEDDGTRVAVRAPSGIVAELQAELSAN